MAADGLFGTVVQVLTGGLTAGKDNSNSFIGRFTEQVNRAGMAYNHLFLVSFTNNAIGDVTNDMSQTMSLFCNSTSIPALNVMTSSYRENEAHFEVPYGISHEPVTMSFYADKGMMIKMLFDNWYHSITKTRTGSDTLGNTNRLAFMDDFTTDITITVLGKDLTPTYKIKLVRAWPKSVGNIDFNAANIDIVNFPVQFVYERLEFVELGLPSSGIVRPNVSTNFPLNLWDDAKFAAGEIIQSVSSAVENVSGAVASIFGGPPQLQDATTTEIRERVVQTPAVNVHYVID